MNLILSSIALTLTSQISATINKQFSPIATIDILIGIDYESDLSPASEVEKAHTHKDGCKESNPCCVNKSVGDDGRRKKLIESSQLYVSAP